MRVNIDWIFRPDSVRHAQSPYPLLKILLAQVRRKTNGNVSILSLFRMVHSQYAYRFTVKENFYWFVSYFDSFNFHDLFGFWFSDFFIENTRSWFVLARGCFVLTVSLFNSTRRWWSFFWFWRGFPRDCRRAIR